LRYLDDHLLNASVSQRLTKLEIRYVARRILEALKVLHEDNFVHTGKCNYHLGYIHYLTFLEDIKPDNILVNYGQGDVRFTDIQVADCGSTVSSDSAYAKDGDLIGAPIWRSPEAQLRIGWGTPTDIWSFGTLVCSFQSLSVAEQC
jgi:serine/threonine protein kinase